jgi:hypothetical protein
MELWAAAKRLPWQKLTLICSRSAATSLSCGRLGVLNVPPQLSVGMFSRHYRLSHNCFTQVRNQSYFLAVYTCWLNVHVDSRFDWYVVSLPMRSYRWLVQLSVDVYAAYVDIVCVEDSTFTFPLQLLSRELQTDKPVLCMLHSLFLHAFLTANIFL